MKNKPQLKPLDQQVMVITGASSGIGLVTAKKAAAAGAKLVLAARNDAALRQLVEQLKADGHEAIHVETDVGDEAAVNAVAFAAIDAFGRIDTWVNNAGVSLYARLKDVATDDARRVFDTNFWGVVYGSHAAVPHLKQQGGALINIGSTLSERAIPLQGIYSASKHAVKGFTDALRMELDEEGAGVAVTLIKPSAIDTPYTEHAMNQLGVEPKNPPPIYSPDLVADAILRAATHPTRDVYVGGGGKMMGALGHIAPSLMDRYMEGSMFKAQRTRIPAPVDERALYRPGFGGHSRGRKPVKVHDRSLYSFVAERPAAALVMGVGAVIALLALRQSRA
jgi:short-subunit dehydrogenase